MRVVVCFLYVVCMLYYIIWATNDFFWFGFNIISMLLFGAMCCMFLASGKKLTGSERLLFWYMFGLNSSRAIYTGFCAHAVLHNKNLWIGYATQIFVFLVAITFFLFLIYLAREKE